MQRECADVHVLRRGARTVVPQVPVEGVVMYNDLLNKRTDHLFGDVIICMEVEVMFEALPQCGDALLVVNRFPLGSALRGCKLIDLLPEGMYLCIKLRLAVIISADVAVDVVGDLTL